MTQTIKCKYKRGGNIANAHNNEKCLFIMVISWILSECNEALGKMSFRLLLPPYNVEVVITEENYGATTPYVYKVLLCATAKADNDNCGEEVLKVDKVDLNEIDLKWSNGRLIISLPDIARVHHFSNFWYSINEPRRQPISIELHIESTSSVED
jgi:hypothetical protein